MLTGQKLDKRQCDSFVTALRLMRHRISLQGSDWPKEGTDNYRVHLCERRSERCGFCSESMAHLSSFFVSIFSYKTETTIILIIPYKYYWEDKIIFIVLRLSKGVINS